MTDEFADSAVVRGYHAHIYYGLETRPIAARLREGMAARFAVELGRWHDEPVGPHPASMYQAAFPVAEFARIVPWLMLNRGPLTVLVHPQTGRSYEDHLAHALWLGDRLGLRLDSLRRGRAA